MSEALRQSTLLEFSFTQPQPPKVEPKAKRGKKETCNAEPMGENCHITGEKAVAETPLWKDATARGGLATMTRKCCPTCLHHKAKKTFEETCPRLPELMFKGGTLPAMQLMLETSLKDCEHWQEKPPKPEKKSASNKSKKPQEETQS